MSCVYSTSFNHLDFSPVFEKKKKKKKKKESPCHFEVKTMNYFIEFHNFSTIFKIAEYAVMWCGSDNFFCIYFPLLDFWESFKIVKLWLLKIRPTTRLAKLQILK